MEKLIEELEAWWDRRPLVDYKNRPVEGSVGLDAWTGLFHAILDRFDKQEGKDIKYIPWAYAGGPNECKHGFAEGIPCPYCDKPRRKSKMKKADRDFMRGYAVALATLTIQPDGPEMARRTLHEGGFIFKDFMDCGIDKSDMAVLRGILKGGKHKWKS